MARSFLNQLYQVAASATYNDGISSPHSSGVAEGQSNLEGDLNVVRTLVKNALGTTNWYDEPEMTIQGIADKYFLTLIHVAGFEGVSVAGSSTTAFDTAIKGITNHNSGAGGSSAEGVVTGTTWGGSLDYILSVRDSNTWDPIDDGSNNEVYGRLEWDGSQYVVHFYSWVSGSETSYSMGTGTTVDLAYVAVSRRFEDISWEQWIDYGWHDVSGMVGTILDDNVVVGGFSYLLNGMTNQEQINNKLDLLGSTSDGDGAELVAIDDSASGSNSYYAGDNLQSVIEELKTQLGGATSSTYDFGENNVLADDDAVYAGLNKLDLKWGDLASTANGEGASLVGVEDAGGYFTGTDVEAVLQEIGLGLENVSGWEKVDETLASGITSGASHTLPSSASYTPDAGSPGANMDVYYNGQLLLAGSGNDYTEDAGSPSTSVTFLFDVPSGANLIYSIRK